MYGSIEPKKKSERNQRGNGTKSEKKNDKYDLTEEKKKAFGGHFNGMGGVA